jgi:hypothetical protein
MALQFAIVAAVAGAVLGLRYNVLVLVPAVMFAMLFAVIVGIARGDGLWFVTLMTALLAAAIQVGYVAGAALQVGVGSIRAALARRRGNPELGAWGPLWSSRPAAPRIRNSQHPQG